MEQWEPIGFVVQLAAILLAAVALGHGARKYLKLPSLVGEIFAGILIGPFALGGITLWGAGPLFPPLEGSPVSHELQALSVLAAVLLLFASGLQAHLRAFLSQSTSSLAVGIGGVVIGFSAGAGFAVMAGVAESMTDTAALMLGAATSATSIGIAARVLAERQKSVSPEGVTIMGAAVLDDILVILTLSIILGTSHAAETDIALPSPMFMALYALGAWLVFFTASLLLARPVTVWIKRSRQPVTMATLALGIALLIAGLFERFGLSLVLGAYVAGLALSQTDIVDVIQDRLRDVYDILVPIFFCVLGMHVDPGVLISVLGISLVYAAVAFVTKMVGCGLPALATGFNLRGAFRIGSGMVPRGEVALIIATLGLNSGLIDSNIFSMVMTMTLISILLGPYVFARSLEGGSGLRHERDDGGGDDLLLFTHTFPDSDIAFMLMSRINRAFRDEEFFVHVQPGRQSGACTIRQGKMVISMRLDGPTLVVRSNHAGSAMARLMIIEELLQFEELAATFPKIGDLNTDQDELFRQVLD